ncbi:MAG: DUF2281 domain-containing protein [Cyanobacteria bacterium J06633_8]
MNVKEQIIQELEKISESQQKKVLDYLRNLKVEHKENSENQVWEAYLESEREHNS